MTKLTYRKIQSDLDEVLDQIVQGEVGRSHILVNCTPAGGKSVLPQIGLKKLKDAGIVEKLCWIAPRDNLRKQAAEDFLDHNLRELVDHNFTIFESSNDFNPSRGTDGYATTYQSIGMDSSGINAAEFERFNYLLVLDEFHHVEHGGTWHRHLQPLVDRAAFMILMTGTLERGDGRPVAFVPYMELSHAINS